MILCINVANCSECPFVSIVTKEGIKDYYCPEIKRKVSGKGIDKRCPFIERKGGER